jgi:hypothetical protein
MRRPTPNTAHATEKLGVKRDTANVNPPRKLTKKLKDKSDVNYDGPRELKESVSLQQTLPA